MEEEQTTDFKKKEFSYRGKSINELKELDVREFAKLLKANEKRSALRQHNELHDFLQKCLKNTHENTQIKTHSRELIIVPQMIGLRIQVYNGKTFIPVDIIPEMLGHRLGEFSATRNKVKHGAAGVGATKGSASKSVK